MSYVGDYGSQAPKELEKLGALYMNVELKEMLQEQARHEQFDVLKSLLGCKL